MKDSYPLAWPEGRPRTLIQNRLDKKAWKRTILEYKHALEEELRKMGARSVVVTSNLPKEAMGGKNPPLRDPGVAVYFVRPPAEDDFSWQEVLGISVPDPSIAQIDSAYNKLAMQYHPDRGGDIEMFKAVNEARKRAKAWVTGDYGREHEFVIECDRYKEVRLNMAAIRIAVNALRRIEECGASSILERAWKGFEEIPEVASSARTA